MSDHISCCFGNRYLACWWLLTVGFCKLCLFVCLNFATSRSSHSNMQLESHENYMPNKGWCSVLRPVTKRWMNCQISSLTLHLQGWNHSRAGEHQPPYSSLCQQVWPRFQVQQHLGIAEQHPGTSTEDLSPLLFPSPVVNTQFSISHFQHLSSMLQYPWCHLPGSWLRVIDIHQTFPRFWNASFSVKLHSCNVLNVWKVFLLDLPICCILVELIRGNPCMSVPTWNPVDFESSA